MVNGFIMSRPFTINIVAPTESIFIIPTDVPRYDSEIQNIEVDFNLSSRLL